MPASDDPLSASFDIYVSFVFCDYEDKGDYGFDPVF
jgi:hypothetical protein